MSYIKFVEEEINSWRCKDGGLTNAACDTLEMAYHFQDGEPTSEEYFSSDFATNYAARLWTEYFNYG